jgi:serine/threonine-protein kinase
MSTCPRCNSSFPDDVGTCPNDGTALVAGSDEDLPAGMMVGEYRIEKKLGEGGFGAVYRAVHHLIEKAVAIKVLNRMASADPAMVSRFTSEARVVNQIRHRNIVDIFAFGKLPDGRHYHVMELLDGLPLDEHLDARGRLSFEDARPILRGVARALSAAHAAGVVHRDLKPANIFLVRDEDAGFVPKLIDFGIAKLSDDQASHKTKTGAMMGTAYYMSPEQCRGKGVDARTDIYAFGVVVHVMLTGHKLFDGESVMDVVMKQITEPPGRMSAMCPAVPAALDEPVLRMLEKDPARRPATILEALSALEAAAGGAVVEGVASARTGATDATIVDDAPRGSLPSISGERPGFAQDTTSAQAISQVHPAGTSAAGRGAGSSRARSAAIVVACLAAAGVGFGAMLSVFSGPSGAQPAPLGAGSVTASPAGDSASPGGTGQPPSVTPVGAAPAESASSAASSASSAAPALSAAPAASPAKGASSASATPATSAAPVPSTTAASGAPRPSSSAAAGAPTAAPPKKPTGRPQDDLDF